jgi:hypothetical protein
MNIQTNMCVARKPFIIEEGQEGLVLGIGPLTMIPYWSKTCVDLKILSHAIIT